MSEVFEKIGTDTLRRVAAAVEEFDQAAAEYIRLAADAWEKNRHALKVYAEVAYALREAVDEAKKGRGFVTCFKDLEDCGSCAKRGDAFPCSGLKALVALTKAEEL